MIKMNGWCDPYGSGGHMMFGDPYNGNGTGKEINNNFYMIYFGNGIGCGENFGDCSGGGYSSYGLKGGFKL